MQKAAVLVIILAFFLALAVDVQAANLAGVTMVDTVQVGGTTLVLNGLGLRKKFVVKVYVAGLYLPKKASDAEAILKEDSPKRIVMHFLHSASKDQITDAFAESFNTNAPDVAKAMKADVDRLFSALGPMKEGDQMVFTYVPGTGTTLAVNGADKITIANPGFDRLLLSVWLGPKPPNADLKKGMLGM
jgi:hypothetical protein